MARANGNVGEAEIVGPDGAPYRRGRRLIAAQLLPADPDKDGPSVAAAEIIELTSTATLLARVLARQAVHNYIIFRDIDGSWTLTLRNGHRLHRYRVQEDALNSAVSLLTEDGLGGKILLHAADGQQRMHRVPATGPLPRSFHLELVRDGKGAAGVQVHRFKGGDKLGVLDGSPVSERVASALVHGRQVSAMPALVPPADAVDNLVGWLGPFQLYAAISFG